MQHDATIHLFICQSDLFLEGLTLKSASPGQFVDPNAAATTSTDVELTGQESFSELSEKLSSVLQLKSNGDTDVGIGGDVDMIRTSEDEYQSANEDFFFVNSVASSSASGTRKQSRTNEYELLKALDDVDLIVNQEKFDCQICFTTIGVCEGVVLRDCLHSYCR